MGIPLERAKLAVWAFVILKKARPRWKRVEKENVAWQRPTWKGS
jgi:hypothetical protein